MSGDGKLGKEPASENADLLAALGFAPDSVLMNDPKLFVDPRFLSSLLSELENELGAEDARDALFQIGAGHGYRDALRIFSDQRIAESERGGMPICASTSLAMTLSTPRFESDRFEICGEWPERHEAEARLDRLGRAEKPACRLSAGYTSGWLSQTHETEVLVIETECAAAGADACRFRALDAVSFVAEFGRAMTPTLPRATEPNRSESDLADPTGLRPPWMGGLGQIPEFDPDEQAVLVWGPVMVLSVTNTDDALRTIEDLRRDPSVEEVRVVVLDLRGHILDDDLGAAGLEHILSVVESWGAESILSGVSPLSEHVVAELESARLVTRKELPDAITAAFQIAEAQRHVL